MSIIPQQDLVDAVRNWVHFDNLAESLTKQVNNARRMRTDYETKILTLLEATSMLNAVLQINGATLQRKVRVRQTDLSWTFLEEQLHQYFKQRNLNDDTQSIMDHIQASRASENVQYLKKNVNADGGKGKKQPIA